MRQKPTKLLNNIRNYITERKRLFILLGFFIALYLLIKGISEISSSFRVIEFTFLLVVIGIAPAYFLRNIFPYKNIVGWLTNASVFGIFFIPLLFLLFGWLHFNFIFIHSIFILRLLAIISMLILFLCMQKNLIPDLVSFNGLYVVDYFFFGVFFAFTSILTLQNMTDWFPRWDVFTYWGLDAKYIFNFNKLHGNELDIFWRFRQESSFITVIYSLIYDFYGKVVEQFASWINVFINLIAMLLVYNLSYKKSVFQKLLLVTASTIISYTADDTAFMYSLYGDIISAFLLLVFTLILTTDYQYRLKNYGVRFLLLLLISLSFSLVKSKFLFLTIGLPFIVLIYDFQYLKREWKSIFRTPTFILCLLIVLLFWGSYITFQTTVWGGYTLTTGVETFVQPSEYSLLSYFSYTKDLITRLLNYSRYVTILWIISVISVVFVKNPLKNKRFSFTYVLTIFGFLFFIIAYINKQYPLLSGSLIRYTSLVIYLIPSVFILPDYHIPAKLLGTSQPQDTKILRIISICILTFVVVYLFNYKIYRVAPVNHDVKFVGGSFTDAMPYHSSISDKVLKIAEEDARILIADDKLKANLVDNLNQTAIFIRYYLMNNSIGGQYRTTIDEIIPFAEQNEADYILLLSYENSFPNCEHLLEGGKDYLIALDNPITIAENICPFSQNTIYGLTEE